MVENSKPRLLPIKLDQETKNLIQKYNLELEDIAEATCLQFQKYQLCPCASKNLIPQCELQEI